MDLLRVKKRNLFKKVQIRRIYYKKTVANVTDLGTRVQLLGSGVVKWSCEGTEPKPIFFFSGTVVDYFLYGSN